MLKKINNLKLGALILTGTVLLIITLYLVGAKSNLFSQTYTVNAVFKNVSGLMSGNNVRFAGINIGTVKEVNIQNDSTVLVKMVIQKDAMRFIRKNSMTDIGSDGLMGNKLINISSPEDIPGDLIKDGDTLYSLKPIETDMMMRTLSNTNDNIYDITNDLKVISMRIKENNSLWKLLADSMLVQNIRKSGDALEKTLSNATSISENLNKIVSDLKAGQGPAGKVLNDQSMADDIDKTLNNLRAASDTARIALNHMKEFMKDLNITPGPLGVLARDTAMANDMKSMIHNLNLSTATLDENMKALQSNVFFRGYFRKKEKEAKKKAAGK